MHCFIARLKVKDGRESEFEALMSDFARRSREEEAGTLVYDLLRPTTPDGTMVMYARFADQESYRAHQATDHYRRTMPGLLDALGAEMELEFFDWIG